MAFFGVEGNNNDQPFEVLVQDHLSPGLGVIGKMFGVGAFLTVGNLIKGAMFVA